MAGRAAAQSQRRLRTNLVRPRPGGGSPRDMRHNQLRASYAAVGSMLLQSLQIYHCPVPAGRRSCAVVNLARSERGGSVLTGVDQIAEDRLLTNSPAGFQPMQSLDQDEALPIAADQDRILLADLEDARGDLRDGRGLERRAAFHGHIDVGNREGLTLQHAPLAPRVNPWRFIPTQACGRERPHRFARAQVRALLPRLFRSSPGRVVVT